MAALFMIEIRRRFISMKDVWNELKTNEKNSLFYIVSLSFIYLIKVTC